MVYLLRSNIIFFQIFLLLVYGTGVIFSFKYLHISITTFLTLSYDIVVQGLLSKLDSPAKPLDPPAVLPTESKPEDIDEEIY